MRGLGGAGWDAAPLGLPGWGGIACLPVEEAEVEVTEITRDNRVIRGAGLWGGPAPAEGPGESPKEEIQQMLTDDSEVPGWTKGRLLRSHFSSALGSFCFDLRFLKFIKLSTGWFSGKGRGNWWVWSPGGAGPGQGCSKPSGSPCTHSTHCWGCELRGATECPQGLPEVAQGGCNAVGRCPGSALLWSPTGQAEHRHLG